MISIYIDAHEEPINEKVNTYSNQINEFAELADHYKSALADALKQLELFKIVGNPRAPGKEYDCINEN